MSVTRFERESLAPAASANQLTIASAVSPCPSPPTGRPRPYLDIGSVRKIAGSIHTLAADSGRELRQILAVLHDETRLCIACDLTLPSQQIISQSVRQWRKMPALPSLKKRPAIFVLHAGQ